MKRMPRLEGCRITNNLEDNIYPGVVLGSNDQAAVLLRLGVPQHRPLSLQSQRVSIVSIERPSPSLLVTSDIQYISLIHLLAWLVCNERLDGVFIKGDNI